MIISMVYIVAVDRKLINDHYILFAQIIMFAVFFMTMIITVHHRIKYGNKDWKYKEDTKLMIIVTLTSSSAIIHSLILLND